MPSRATRRRRALLLAAALATALAAATPAHARDRATIRWTEHGIPHVLADDFRGLGYGYGYAVASQNLCTLADTYVTVRAERSRFFGPDAGWEFHANGTTNTNLDSDFFHRRIIDRRVVERLVGRPPPHGPLPQVRQLVRGYVAGYNRYLRRTGVDGIRDPACRGRPWVRPITEMDVYRRYHQLGTLVSAGLAIDEIGGAQPPPPGDTPAPGLPTAPDALDPLLGRLGNATGRIGSNAYALGRRGTRSGAGMVLGNPHFPWEGAERFFQAHLTIPGRYDVAGATLLGTPVVLIGHTDRLAWSHTVSPAWRFTPFEERLVPGSPTTYLHDGRPRAMRRDRVTVRARTPDGALEPRTRTLYSTHHGPILTGLAGTPLFPWTPERAYSLGDANAQHMRFLNHFFEMGRSRSTTQLLRALRRHQGVPWVHTLAADSAGRALYADISVVPHVTDAKARSCNTAVGHLAFERLRLPVLDGSRSACEWGRDRDAVQPGIFGPANLPRTHRADYVANANDSHWLPNPRRRLEGFPRIVGDERTERSLRTRLALRMAEQRLAGTDGLAGRRFTLSQLQRAALNNRNLGGELMRDDLVRLCERRPVVTTEQGPVDIREACPVLRRWDGRANLRSRGEILFRRFADRLLTEPGDPPGENMVGGGGTPADVWLRPFDPGDPLNTPRDLNTENPRTQNSLGLAVKELRDAGIPLDAPLGDHQSEPRGDERIPIHGGPGKIGVFNQIEAPFSGPEGFPDVVHGTSFLMAAEMTGRCPRVRTILAYSQSTDPTSPFHADQTRLFSARRWVRGRFCEEEIRRAPGLRVTRLGGGAGGRPPARRPSLTG